MIGDDVLVEELPLSYRTATVLRNEGYRTVGQIRSVDDAALLRFSNFGRKSLAEIRSLTGYAEGVARVESNAAQRAAQIRHIGNQIQALTSQLASLIEKL